jgi:hypothetical protein
VSSRDGRESGQRVVRGGMRAEKVRIKGTDACVERGVVLKRVASRAAVQCSNEDRGTSSDADGRRYESEKVAQRKQGSSTAAGRRRRGRALSRAAAAGAAAGRVGGGGRRREANDRGREDAARGDLSEARRGCVRCGLGLSRCRRRDRGVASKVARLLVKVVGDVVGREDVRQLDLGRAEAQAAV